MSLSLPTTSIDDLTICPICQSTLRRPVACLSCENAFCSSCIQQWLSSQPTASCPFGCPSPFVERRCPSVLLSLLSKLILKCKYESVGCSLSLPYDQIDHHEQIDCKYATIECTWCHRSIVRRTMDKHFNEECETILIKCSHCQFVTTRKEMENNHELVYCLQIQLQNVQQRTLALESMIDLFDEMNKKSTNTLKDMEKELNKLKTWKVGRTITFDNLPGADLTTGPMPVEYAQLKWLNASYLHQSFASSYYRKSGLASAFKFPIVGDYIVCGDGTHPLIISSANMSVLFDVKLLILSSAYNPKLVMVITGWREGIEMYEARGFVKPSPIRWPMTPKWENIDTIAINVLGDRKEGELSRRETLFGLIFIAMS